MPGFHALIYLLFFASGMSGLVYEVVWVRQFGLLFGSTVYSAALVTSIYMLGLGLGSYLAGRWVDRRVRTHPAAPVRAYGLFELGIALLAGAILLAIPEVAELAARASSYVPDEKGWLRLSLGGSVFRYGCSALLLTPITLLMGGTLTLLIRHLVGNDVGSAGRHVGVLYGINTAGAALGCLLTDTTFVPAFGLQRTQLLAIGLNLFAAAGALLLARRVTGPSPGDPPPAPRSGARDPRVAWAGLAIGLSGFAAMAMQIVWFRHLISLFGGYRPVFSILLTVILLGIWIGSMLGGALTSRIGRPGTIFTVALGGFVVWALAALWSVDASATYVQKRILADPVGGPLPFTLYLLRSTAWVVGPPALLSGMAFPLANALVQRASERVGERAGILYLSNTVGGVIGSLGAGFWLLPLLGIQHTATLVAGSVLVAIGAVALAARDSEPRAPWIRGAALAAGLAAAVVWAQLPDRSLMLRTVPLNPGEEVLAAREGVNETIAVTDREGSYRRLLTNGHSMSTTGFVAQRYMRAFVHVPMLLTDQIERVMVMCFGVGNTANSVLLHPTVKQLDVVDLSADILEHARYFEPVNGRPLEDPRVRVHVNDGRQHLRMDGPKYDLITGEPPPIAHAGVASLYTRDFYELARERLNPGGFITYWVPMNQVGEAAGRSMIAAFLEIFPDAVLLSGYRQQLMLVGRKDAPFALDPDVMRRRIAEVPGLRSELRWISLSEPAEVAATFAASPETMARATRGHPVLEDDHPYLEYGSRLVTFDRRLPPDLFSVEDVEVWCPRCMDGGLSPSERRDLEGALEVIGSYYQSAAFLEHQPGQRAEFKPELGPLARQSVMASLYLQQLVGRAPPQYFRAARELRHGRTPEAVKALERLVRDRPGLVIARIDLADLYLEMGRTDLARAQLEKAREQAPKGRRVEAAWRRFEAAVAGS